MRILTITTPDMENGIGCRVTLWFAGCSHRCPGCHNQHTWDYNQGTQITKKSVWDKIVDAVDHDYIQGITLCGGDPLDQDEKSLKELNLLLNKFKKKFPNKDIWIYAGDVYENIIKDKNKLLILHQCNVLVDGPFVQKLHDPELAFRGSSNQRIIDIPRTIIDKKITLLNYE